MELIASKPLNEIWLKASVLGSIWASIEILLGSFLHCKFPVHKAFYIAYTVCKGTDDLSTYEFARRLYVRQMTCWNFKTKIQHAIDEMSSLSENEKLSIKKILTS